MLILFFSLPFKPGNVKNFPKRSSQQGGVRKEVKKITGVNLSSEMPLKRCDNAWKPMHKQNKEEEDDEDDVSRPEESLFLFVTLLIKLGFGDVHSHKVSLFISVHKEACFSLGNHRKLLCNTVWSCYWIFFLGYTLLNYVLNYKQLKEYNDTSK